MVSHDQFFKELLRGFFPDFLRLFLPALAAALELEAGVEFLDTQDFTDRPAGDLRLADLVARMRTREGRPALVHTEVEAEPGGEFGERVWEYNALLSMRHRLPAVSLAVLPFTVGEGVELVLHTAAGPDRAYARLEYWRVPLRGLAAHDYVAAGPALGAALAALMRPGPGGKVELKAAIFARLRRDDVSPGARSMLLNFVETYLPLDAEEQAAFAQRYTPEGDTTMEALERTWADQFIEQGLERGLERGLEQGRVQGIKQGRVQGIEQGMERGALAARQETLRRQVRLRFGAAPAALEARLPALDAAGLDAALDRVVLSPTLDDFLSAL